MHDKLQSQGVQKPSVNLTSEAMGMNANDTISLELALAARSATSLNKVEEALDVRIPEEYEGSGTIPKPVKTTFSELATDDSTFAAVSEAQLKLEIGKVLSTLTDRERTIIALRFGLCGEEPMTQAEIGKEFGVSRGRIYQLESKALKKLRHPRISDRLRGWLED